MVSVNYLGVLNIYQKKIEANMRVVILTDGNALLVKIEFKTNNRQLRRFFYLK